MSKQKTCFVISPIGEPNSETRLEADLLLDIIKKAMEIYDFRVIRIDEITATEQITNQIVLLIQEADLCIIILTNSNPNVFYEAGRRHETGKPFIQMIRLGQKIPFDIAGIRTIYYGDVQTFKAAAETIDTLRKFVEGIQEWGPQGTSVSLSSIGQAIDRLERKIDQNTSRPVSLPSDGSFTSPKRKGSAFGNPIEIMQEAMARGDLETAIAVYPRFVSVVKSYDMLLMVSVELAEALYKPAVDTLIMLLKNHMDELGGPDSDEVQITANMVVSYFIQMDQEKQGLPILREICEQVFEQKDLNTETAAFWRNKIVQFLYAMEEYQEALPLIEEIVSLTPENVVYLENLSRTYRKLNRLEDAAEQIDKIVKLVSGKKADDDDLWAHAAVVFAKLGRIEDCRKAWAEIRRINPQYAQKLLIEQDDISKILNQN